MMDIDFNYQTIRIDKFAERRATLIIDLAKWITPYMNEIHKLDHGYQFWLRILRNHLKICVNKKHVFEQLSLKEVPRYLVDVNAFGTPEGKRVRTETISFLSKPFRSKTTLKSQQTVLSANNKLTLGHRAKELADDGKGVVLDEYHPYFFLPDFKARKKWKEILNRAEEDFLAKVIKHLPRIYIEFFKQNYYSEQLIDPKSKSFHAEHIGSLYSQTLIGKYYEAGAKYFLYQAGCGQGETEYHPDQPEYETCTNYITYGWKRHEKDLPGKAYRLETYKGIYNLNKSKTPKVHDFLLVLSESDEELRKHYKSFTEYFTGHIISTKYKRVLLRPRPRSKKMDNSKEVSYISITENTIVDNGKDSLVYSALKSRCNVLVYTPATNLYECAITYHPFMAYNMFPPISKLFQKHIDFFYEVGILHDSAESMVEYLNDIDLDIWWQGVIQDERYELFLEEFCGKQIE